MTAPRALSDALGRTIAAERVAAGLSQRELAQTAGMSPEAVYRYETGKRDIPFRALTSVADVLGLAVSHLVADAEQRAARAGANDATGRR
jgi:transcriptional regulator with XRE-family HTH domain